MILYFNPFQEIIDIYNDLKKVDFDIILEWVQNKDLKDEDGKQCYGVTIWPDDLGAIVIQVSSEIDLSFMTEILAHEFAHVLTGIKNKHNKKWRDMFNFIRDEFIDRINAHGNIVKDAEINFRKCMNGRLMLLK